MGRQEPNILSLCTARFGSAQPPSGGTSRQCPPRKVRKQSLESERRKSSKKTTTTAARRPLRDQETSVSSREIALVWKAEYRARCCRHTPDRPWPAPEDQTRARGFHLAVGPGVAGIGSWLGAANSSPLAQQFAGAGLLAALRGEGPTPPSSRDYQHKPLRYTRPRPAVSSAPSGEGSKPGTRGDPAAWPDEYGAPKRLAAFDAPAPAHMDGGPTAPELAALLATALSDSGSASPPPPDLVPDEMGSEAEDEARPRDTVPGLSLHTAPAPTARPHEPVTPTSPSLETYEMDVDREPGAKKAVPRTPVRQRATKPAFGLMTPPPSVARL